MVTAQPEPVQEQTVVVPQPVVTEPETIDEDTAFLDFTMAPEVADEPAEVVQAATPQAPEDESSWFSFGGIFDSVSDTVEDVTDAIFLGGDDD